MYLAYSFLVVLAVLLGSPYFVYQAIRHRKYVGSLRQRLGRLPISLNLDSDASIWIHAVSVGEVLSARPLVEALRQRYPMLRLYVSTTTMTGQQVVRLAFDPKRGFTSRELLATDMGRIRDIRQSPDGYIYLVTDDRDGKPTPVYRMEPVARTTSR